MPTSSGRSLPACSSPVLRAGQGAPACVRVLAAIGAVLLMMCGQAHGDPAAGGTATSGQAADAGRMDAVAARYVKLVLALGRHDAGYVDAYYGPPAWKEEAAAAKRSLDDIDREAAALLAELGSPPSGAGPEDPALLRHAYLARQIEALRARVAMLQGRRLSFDEESRALYDAVAPRHAE